MPHMARTTILLLVSLASISHVAARALPQFYPGSAGSGGGSTPSSTSMNIESEEVDTGNQVNDNANQNGNANVDNLLPQAVNWEGEFSPSIDDRRTSNAQAQYFEEELDEVPQSSSVLNMLGGQLPEGLYESQGNQQNGGVMLIEEDVEDDRSPNAASFDTQADEYVDAGFDPDQEALLQDLQYTGGRQPFDLAPQNIPQIQDLSGSQAIANNQPQVQEVLNLDAATDVVGSGPASPAGTQAEGQIIEIEEAPSRYPPPLIDITAFPPLASDEVVSIDNEIDLEGNMRILTEAPDLDLLYERRREAAGPDEATKERNRRLERENQERLSRRRSSGSRSTGRKFLPDHLLPEGADTSSSYPLLNENGEPANEYGLLLDENGEPIPESDDPYADDGYDEDQVNIVIDQTSQAIAGGEAGTDAPSSANSFRKQKPSRYKFEKNLNQYLSQFDTSDESKSPGEYTSARSNIARQSSLNFRRPAARQRNGRGNRRQRFSRNYNDVQSPYGILGQPYINNMSAQEIEDSILAQAALDSQQRAGNSNQQSSNQQVSNQPQAQATDPFEMSPDDIMQLFALQAEQEAEQNNQAYRSGSDMAQQAMAAEAEAGGVPTRRRRAQNRGTQAGRYYDQSLYDLASQAFRGNSQLSSINNLAMPSGNTPYDFDLNINGGGAGNVFNPGPDFRYDESLDINAGGLEQEILPPELVRTSTNAPAGDYVRQNPSTMTEAELIDFLTKLDIEVGIGNDLYPIEYLREMVAQLMGGDI
ncbi:hypothetical protein TWF718_006585 [Orbilia javanica]|uniref:Uncharacterized protein n=1 Tax=Orbilia javanica TaxID=47235 RepID=A0AAN8MYM5_9PEZI